MSDYNCLMFVCGWKKEVVKGPDIVTSLESIASFIGSNHFLQHFNAIELDFVYGHVAGKPLKRGYSAIKQESGRT